MKIQTRYLPFAIAIIPLLNVYPLSAQTLERRQNAPTSVAPPKQELPIPAVSVNPTEILALEIGQLRKSLQTLNARLREIGETLTAPNSQPSTESNIKQNRILLNFEILSRAEQRAEILRKQFIELAEKENAVKTKLIQMEEDVRPENIERGLNTAGSTLLVVTLRRIVFPAIQKQIQDTAPISN